MTTQATHTFIYLLLLSFTTSCAQNTEATNKQTGMNKDKNIEEATFGAGCFWCVEAIFQQLKGVETVTAGYAGGRVPSPTYEAVCSGTTGHAEVCHIEFNPAIITYEQLLTVFWHSHDPTTLNRQGADKGTQYRSVIFYHNEEQQRAARQSIAATDSSGLWPKPIVTQIAPLTNYSAAENYHQNYFANNAQQPYCSFVIAPKVAKLKKEFRQLLKEEYR